MLVWSLDGNGHIPLLRPLTHTDQGLSKCRVKVGGTYVWPKRRPPKPFRIVRHTVTELNRPFAVRRRHPFARLRSLRKLRASCGLQFAQISQEARGAISV